MEIEDLYNDYKKLYIKTNFFTLSKKYLDLFDRMYLYISMFLTLFAIIIYSIYIVNVKPEIMLTVILIGIISFQYYFRYYYALSEKIIKQHGLNKNKNVDFIFVDVFFKLKNDDKFTNNIEKLIEFSNLSIEEDSNGYFHNPIIILLISFIMALLVNIITSDSFIETSVVVKIIFAMFYFLLLLNIYYTGNNNVINKNLRFKRFLLKAKYEIVNLPSK